MLSRQLLSRQVAPLADWLARELVEHLRQPGVRATPGEHRHLELLAGIGRPSEGGSGQGIALASWNGKVVA